MNKILGQSAFWIVNKALAKEFKDNDTALLLSELIDKQSYYQSINELKDGMFFMTSNMIEEQINITYRRQKVCIAQLVSLNLLYTKLMGTPARLFYRVNEQEVMNLIVSLCKSSISETSKLESTKCQNIINNRTNNKKRERENLPIDILEVRKQKAFEYIIPHRQSFGRIRELEPLTIEDLANDWWDSIGATQTYKDDNAIRLSFNRHLAYLIDKKLKPIDKPKPTYNKPSTPQPVPQPKMKFGSPEWNKYFGID